MFQQRGKLLKNENAVTDLQWDIQDIIVPDFILLLKSLRTA